MRFRLRTLLIVLALGPPLIWCGWRAWESLNPAPPYNCHEPDLRYYAPGPEFKLTREAVRQKQIEAEKADESRSPLPSR
jgi:hypothetical protein